MYINATFSQIMSVEEKINSLYALMNEMEFYSGFGSEFHRDTKAVESEIRSLKRKLDSLRKEWEQDADCTVCIL